MDGLKSLHEILHESKKREQQRIVLKLEFKKAYDKVNLYFLIYTLKERGLNATEFPVVSLGQ